MHMDYFNDVFTTFLGFDSFSFIAVCGRQKALNFFKNILQGIIYDRI